MSKQPHQKVFGSQLVLFTGELCAKRLLSHVQLLAPAHVWLYQFNYGRGTGELFFAVTVDGAGMQLVPRDFKLQKLADFSKDGFVEIAAQAQPKVMTQHFKGMTQHFKGMKRNSKDAEVRFNQIKKGLKDLKRQKSDAEVMQVVSKVFRNYKDGKVVSLPAGEDVLMPHHFGLPNSPSHKQAHKQALRLAGKIVYHLGGKDKRFRMYIPAGLYVHPDLHYLFQVMHGDFIVEGDGQKVHFLGDVPQGIDDNASRQKKRLIVDGEVYRGFPGMTVECEGNTPVSFDMGSDSPRFLLIEERETADKFCNYMQTKTETCELHVLCVDETQMFAIALTDQQVDDLDYRLSAELVSLDKNLVQSGKVHIVRDLVINQTTRYKKQADRYRRYGLTIESLISECKGMRRLFQYVCNKAMTKPGLTPAAIGGGGGGAKQLTGNTLGRQLPQADTINHQMVFGSRDIYFHLFSDRDLASHYCNYMSDQFRTRFLYLLDVEGTQFYAVGFSQRVTQMGGFQSFDCLFKLNGALAQNYEAKTIIRLDTSKAPRDQLVMHRIQEHCVGQYKFLQQEVLSAGKSQAVKATPAVPKSVQPAFVLQQPAKTAPVAPKLVQSTGNAKPKHKLTHVTVVELGEVKQRLRLHFNQAPAQDIDYGDFFANKNVKQVFKAAGIPYQWGNFNREGNGGVAGGLTFVAHEATSYVADSIRWHIKDNSEFTSGSASAEVAAELERILSSCSEPKVPMTLSTKEVEAISCGWRLNKMAHDVVKHVVDRYKPQSKCYRDIAELLYDAINEQLDLLVPRGSTCSQADKHAVRSAIAQALVRRDEIKDAKWPSNELSIKSAANRYQSDSGPVSSPGLAAQVAQQQIDDAAHKVVEFVLQSYKPRSDQLPFFCSIDRLLSDKIRSASEYCVAELANNAANKLGRFLYNVIGMQDSDGGPLLAANQPEFLDNKDDYGTPLSTLVLPLSDRLMDVVASHRYLPQFKGTVHEDHALVLSNAPVLLVNFLLAYSATCIGQYDLDDNPVRSGFSAMNIPDQRVADLFERTFGRAYLGTTTDQFANEQDFAAYIGRFPMLPDLSRVFVLEYLPETNFLDKTDIVDHVLDVEGKEMHMILFSSVEHAFMCACEKSHLYNKDSLFEYYEEVRNIYVVQADGRDYYALFFKDIRKRIRMEHNFATHIYDRDKLSVKGIFNFRLYLPVLKRRLDNMGFVANTSAILTQAIQESLDLARKFDLVPSPQYNEFGLTYYDDRQWAKRYAVRHTKPTAQYKHSISPLMEFNIQGKTCYAFHESHTSVEEYLPLLLSPVKKKFKNMYLYDVEGLAKLAGVDKRLLVELGNEWFLCSDKRITELQTVMVVPLDGEITVAQIAVINGDGFAALSSLKKLTPRNPFRRFSMMTYYAENECKCDPSESLERKIALGLVYVQTKTDLRSSYSYWMPAIDHSRWKGKLTYRFSHLVVTHSVGWKKNQAISCDLVRVIPVSGSVRANPSNLLLQASAGGGGSCASHSHRLVK